MKTISSSKTEKKNAFLMRAARVLYLLPLPLMAACSAYTGIPAHGGGKRFAVEQELVSAATRAAIKQIDLAPLRGKRVNLYVNAMGDTGAGYVAGGRFSIISQLHGDYVQNAAIKENYIYPRYDSTSSTTERSVTHNRSSSSNFGALNTDSSSSSSTSTQTTTSNTLLSAPTSHTTKEGGGAGEIQIGMKYEGLGAFKNSEEITSDDLQYLNAIMQSWLFLQGVPIVPPSEAEVDVYITVDVYGTVYTRVDWFIANKEILRAKTGLEIFAVNTDNGEVVMAPRSAVAEAEYNEQYILWAGPVAIKKSVQKAEPLLCDFTGVLADGKETGRVENEREEPTPTPFTRKKAKKDKAKKSKRVFFREHRPLNSPR